MSRSDSRPRPTRRYGFRRAVAVAPPHHAGSPRTLSPSVDACPPHSPRTARCVPLLVTSASMTGFSTVGSLAAATGFTRPILGSLALGPRLRSRRLLATRPANRTDPFPALGCPPAPDRSYMVNEQFTWPTPRSQLEQVGFPWHTDDTTFQTAAPSALLHEGHQAHKAPQRKAFVSLFDGLQPLTPPRFVGPQGRRRRQRESR